jgi:fumarate hydratase class II
MKRFRTVEDSMGTLEVPADALYGAQTQRAILNFPISGQPMPAPFIHTLITIKAAAAEANRTLGLLPEPITEAILQACQQLLADPDMMRHFPVDIFQTGSGTSSNMNANEVLATLASRLCRQPVSANDHLNFGQSSNDTIPTAIQVSALTKLDAQLLPALQTLRDTIHTKAATLNSHVKTGRTHLMDAMPVRFSQSLESWAAQTDEQIKLLRGLEAPLRQLPQGGTAVGTGVNTHPHFARLFCQALSARCEQHFTPAPNLFSRMAALDVPLALSGQLRGVAVTLMKISNDLRWMNSGPLSGLGEITLEALQPGSSIMPGKVNPVIPEAVTMVSAQVIGFDSANTLAAQSGNFELNVMQPLMAANLLQAIQLLANASVLLAEKAIAGFSVNQPRLEAELARNPILATALNPLIGYQKAAEIAKQAYREGRPILDVAQEQTGLPRDELARLLDPARLTHGGL